MNKLNREEIREEIEQTNKAREKNPLKHYLPDGKTIDNVIELLHCQHLQTGIKGDYEHKPGLFFNLLRARYGERELTIAYARSLNQIDLWLLPLEGRIIHLVTLETSRQIEAWEDLPHPTLDWEELKIALGDIGLMLLGDWQSHFERALDKPRHYEV